MHLYGQAIAQLSPWQGLIFKLIREQNYPRKHVAELLGVTENTVKDG